jgi:CHAT domain-containing protein
MADTPAGCLDPEDIAAHIDDRAHGESAARIEAHLARCADCYAVYAGSLQFALNAAPALAPPVPPPIPRRWLGSYAGAALVAALVAGISIPLYLARYAGPPLGSLDAGVAELAAAVGDRRFVAPRLTGGFGYAPVISPRRSGEAVAESWAVLAAAAKIKKLAETDASPQALGALGVAHLIVGDAGQAVASLESATAHAPTNARLLSDLSAAYLVRAKALDQPADVAKALSAAEQAIATKGAPDEAYFNRALALEGLSLADAAREAWEAYLARDAGSGWADEARQHLQNLTPHDKSSRSEEGATRRTAASPQALRDRLEESLLPAWADAMLANRSEADAIQREIRLVADELLQATGDPQARDSAMALERGPRPAASRDGLQAQARALRTYAEGMRLYDHDRMAQACPLFRQARAGFERTSNPGAGWAWLYVVIACHYPARLDEAVADLAALRTLGETRGYTQLVGRVAWMQGLVHGVRAELADALDDYRTALACFKQTRDTDSEAAVHFLLAENFDSLGESRAAWLERQQALERLGGMRSLRRRHAILTDAVLASLDQGMPRVALHFEDALVATALAWARPGAIAEAFARRALIRHELRAHDQALADLRSSRQWIARIPDEALSRRLEGEVSAAEGEVEAERNPEQAARALGEALRYFGEAGRPRVARLHLLLARALLARGVQEQAERELVAGIEVYENQRATFADLGLQASFFDRAWDLFDEMVRFQVTRRQDPERALAFLERGRARQLLDSLSSAAPARHSPRSARRPLDPGVLRRELPEGIALVYYASLADRLFAWVLERQGGGFAERPLATAELARLAAAHRAAIEGRAPLDSTDLAGSRLHDELIHPLLPWLGHARTLVFVPDAALQSVAFAGLRDRRSGRYLVQDYAVGLAPSGSVFVLASGTPAVRRSTSPRALVVGNPGFDRRLFADLSDLAEAEREAAEIARLYPHAELLIANGATKASFLEGARRSEVVHYAGHAAAGAERSVARLFFAPDAGGHDPGTLLLNELQGRHLPRTRVVVLAACRTAAGAVSRAEGALSLGRPFLAAGVPSVVASLWDIDDAASRRFFVAFHRELLASGDPMEALRQTQLALIGDADSSLRHPASWAAFVSMGAAGPILVPTGGVS